MHVCIKSQQLYSVMITDRNMESVRILTCTATQLTLQTHSGHKMIYKQYSQISPAKEAQIMRWLHLSHPNLLPLHKVQRMAGDDGRDGVTLGMYYQYYANSLEQRLGALGFECDEEEIVNTFQPILEAIQYLALHKYDPAAIRLKNIVITENEEVKFIDECIICPVEVLPQNTDKNAVYLELCQIIYRLLVKNKEEKTPKSWKNRLQIIKKRFTKDTYVFFMTIFNKSLLGLPDPGKTKKICKKKVMEGKENKISQ